MAALKLTSERMCRFVFPCKKFLCHKHNRLKVLPIKNLNLRGLSENCQPKSLTLPVKFSIVPCRKIIKQRSGGPLTFMTWCNDFAQSPSQGDIYQICQSSNFHTCIHKYNGTPSHVFLDTFKVLTEPSLLQIFTYAYLTARRSECCLQKRNLFYKYLPNHLHLSRREYATSTKFTANLENIFSLENKLRVQESMGSVKPIREIPPEVLKSSPKQAAVLVPLCHVDKKPSLLFMVRSREIPKHRGEVCFPGGMTDEVDKDIIQTALRETNEEIGLAIDQVDVWGPAQSCPSRDGSVMVTPVIGYCNDLDLDKLVLDRAEVDQVFTCSIASLCDPSNIRSTQFKKNYTMPVFLAGKHKIWGLTAIFIHQILTLIAPGFYTYKIRHRS